MISKIYTIFFLCFCSISVQVLCKLCNESFITKHKDKKHQKQKHPTKAPICKDSASRNCQRGDKLCWFKHEKTEEFEQEHDNYRVFQKKMVQCLF